MKWSLAIFVAAERPPAPLKAVQFDSQRIIFQGNRARRPALL
jgi:hypothetical protein